jgi:hypothetical protein
MNFRNVFIALVIGTALVVSDFVINAQPPRFVVGQGNDVVSESSLGDGPAPASAGAGHYETRRSLAGAGDEITVSELEHHANSVPGQ